MCWSLIQSKPCPMRQGPISVTAPWCILRLAVHQCPETSDFLLSYEVNPHDAREYERRTSNKIVGAACIGCVLRELRPVQGGYKFLHGAD